MNRTLSKSLHALPIKEVLKTKQNSVVLWEMLKVERKRLKISQNG